MLLTGDFFLVWNYLVGHYCSVNSPQITNNIWPFMVLWWSPSHDGQRIQEQYGNRWAAFGNVACMVGLSNKTALECTQWVKVHISVLVYSLWSVVYENSIPKVYVGINSIIDWSIDCICLTQEQCGSYTFIAYMVSPQGKVFACDATLMRGITEILQPSFTIEPLLTPLVEQLVKLFENVHVHARWVVGFDQVKELRCDVTLIDLDVFKTVIIPME